MVQTGVVTSCRAAADGGRPASGDPRGVGRAGACGQGGRPSRAGGEGAAQFHRPRVADHEGQRGRPRFLVRGYFGPLSTRASTWSKASAELEFDPVTLGAPQLSATRGPRGVAQTVARLVWDQEVVGSSPAAPTVTRDPIHFIRPEAPRRASAGCETYRTVRLKLEMGTRSARCLAAA
jgi:hypothetical protein